MYTYTHAPFVCPPRYTAYRDALRKCQSLEDTADVSGHVRLHLDAMDRREGGKAGRTLPNGTRYAMCVSSVVCVGHILSYILKRK